MSITASALRKLAVLALTAEQMAGVLNILADGQEAEETRLKSQRDRKARQRERDSHGTVTGQERDTPSPLGPLDKETPPKPLKEINPPLTPQPRDRAFAEFWVSYPNKVGKPKALQAFSKALLRTDQQTLMAGLARYVAKTDDRQWCNPATWLSQERWSDQPATVARASPSRTRTIADAASDLLREFENADIRSEPSHQSLTATIHNLPIARIGSRSD